MHLIGALLRYRNKKSVSLNDDADFFFGNSARAYLWKHLLPSGIKRGVCG
jgi:hypothetical protein